MYGFRQTVVKIKMHLKNGASDFYLYGLFYPIEL